MPVVNRKYKDTVFRMLFSEKEKLLELYNALNGSHYDDPEELQINTLEDAVYMNMKNDISFVFQSELTLYEHQSTVNPNMPLRDLFYVSRILRGMAADDDLYREKKLPIPAPEFVVFYNGTRDYPERVVQKLSDLFEIPVDDPKLELKVTVLNINPGYNKEILRACRTLNEYMRMVRMIREQMEKNEDKREAIRIAIDKCIEEGILRDFLIKHRAEAEESMWYDYNEELHLKNVREDSYADGLEDGLEKGRSEERNRYSSLIRSLSAAGRTDEIVQAASDKEKLETLFKEFEV